MVGSGSGDMPFSKLIKALDGIAALPREEQEVAGREAAELLRLMYAPIKPLSLSERFPYFHLSGNQEIMKA